MSAITATEPAIKQIEKYLALRGKGMGIRLGVRTSGCSGMAYVLEYIDSVNSDDNIFKFGDTSIVVDPKSLVYLDGTELDFVKEGLNEGFKFNNPNVKNECGCGESWNV